MERSDPAKIASDTRKGLAKLERMRQNDIRRRTMLQSDEMLNETRQRRRVTRGR
jgi:DNA-binding PadR family transcriptional regulator